MSCGVEVDPLVQITVQKLAVASSLEIFMDILPSYSIRKWSEAEEKQQMKKETKILHEYEQALLRHYQKFLKQLDKFCKCNMKKKLNKIKLTPKLVESCQMLGVKCVTRLLAEQYHFNFRQDLLETVVPLMSYKDETIRNICCESVETVFKSDKLGEASFDIVKTICKFVKDNPTKSHPRMLETFLQLKIKEVEKTDQMAKTKRDILAKKQKIRMMSRKERKTFKRLKKLDDDLAELEAEEKKENVLKFHTKIMSQIFAVYFRVLKREKLGNQPLNKCKILPVVLRGLSKFAHFINIEFFDDLLNSLLNLVLKADLNVTESLNCVKTAFVILSGDGQALNIDPYGFYRFVYNVLPKIADEKRIDYTNILHGEFHSA
uniref:Nucleolar complex-associated protein 3 N-terminal domain-containing protein n=1 Tax=Romanomermis culicivorax TaxID=13658 RepID=A0A915J708_ROMCU